VDSRTVFPEVPHGRLWGLESGKTKKAWSHPEGVESAGNRMGARQKMSHRVKKEANKEKKGGGLRLKELAKISETYSTR